MATFELHQDYPLAQILDESFGSWIVPGLIKGLSSSEALILLRPSEKGTTRVIFPSSQVCLVHFDWDKSWPESKTIDQGLRTIAKLWVFVATEKVAALIRVVPRPLSFVFSPAGWFDLTIPLEPSLSSDEWNRIGMEYVSIVTINESESRCISSKQDAEEVCQYLRQLPSFWLHASRFEGDELDVGADANGVTVFYLNIKRAIKLISLNPSSVRKDIVRQHIDALPEMELETGRRHLIPLERALDILRSFLNKGEPIDMVPWSLDD